MVEVEVEAVQVFASFTRSHQQQEVDSWYTIRAALHRQASQINGHTRSNTTHTHARARVRIHSTPSCAEPSLVEHAIFLIFQCNYHRILCMLCLRLPAAASQFASIITSQLFTIIYIVLATRCQIASPSHISVVVVVAVSMIFCTEIVVYF